MIDVCICTHNPRRDILSLVLTSLAQQSVGDGAFRVLVVDNASSPPLVDSMLDPLRKIRVQVRLSREPILGVSRARLRAASETSGYWVLFVDDDNELFPSYIAEGLEFIKRHPEVGCFGGKLLLARNLNPSRWVVPFLPYLGIKDIGDETQIGKSENWEQWEPPTAGAFVCRPLLDEYRKQSMQGNEVFRLGRQGRNNLASCEDSLIMRNAYRMNLSNAYYPALALYHHLEPSRFRLRYLVRLMYGYGVSHAVLDSILKGPQLVSSCYANGSSLFKMLCWVFGSTSKKSLVLAVGKIAYHLGAWREHSKQKQLLKGVELNG